MSKYLIGRVLNKFTISIYAGILFILIITDGTGRVAIMNMFGGVSRSNSLGMVDVLGIVRWNVSVIPPVAVSILFIFEEAGPLSIYTILRAKNIKRWFLLRVGGIIILNYFYLILGYMLLRLCSADMSSFSEVILLFPMHTIMLSLMSISAYMIARNVKVIMILYLLIDGASVMAGTTVPDLSKYMLGLYGMAQNADLLNKTPLVNATISVSIMLLLSILAVVISIKYLKRNNPAISLCGY